MLSYSLCISASTAAPFILRHSSELGSCKHLFWSSHISLLNSHRRETIFHAHVFPMSLSLDMDSFSYLECAATASAQCLLIYPLNPSVQPIWSCSDRALQRSSHWLMGTVLISGSICVSPMVKGIWNVFIVCFICGCFFYYGGALFHVKSFLLVWHCQLLLLGWWNRYILPLWLVLVRSFLEGCKYEMKDNQPK